MANARAFRNAAVSCGDALYDVVLVFGADALNSRNDFAYKHDPSKAAVLKKQKIQKKLEAKIVNRRNAKLARKARKINRGNR